MVTYTHLFNWCLPDMLFVLCRCLGVQHRKGPRPGERRNGTHSEYSISWSLILSKTLMELIFNSCGEFRWSPEGSVSQIYSPHLHVGAPGIFWDLLRFVQMRKRKWDAESKGKLTPVKLQPWFLSLQWKTCLWTELQPWFCVCSGRPALGQNTLMMMVLRFYGIIP